MKKCFYGVLAACGLTMVAGGAEMKAAWFRADITPAVGTKIAGYGPDDVSMLLLPRIYPFFS